MTARKCGALNASLKGAPIQYGKKKAAKITNKNFHDVGVRHVVEPK